MNTQKFEFYEVGQTASACVAEADGAAAWPPPGSSPLATPRPAAARTFLEHRDLR